MNIEQLVYTGAPSIDPFTINLPFIFAFGHREILEHQKMTHELAKRYSATILSECSTSGEIITELVRDGKGSCVATKLVPKQMVEEEVKSISQVLNQNLNHTIENYGNNPSPFIKVPDNTHL